MAVSLRYIPLMIEDFDRFSPQMFRDGTEPDWVVGYEMTAEGWKPMDAARDAELVAEADAEIANGHGIDHETVMAELHANIAAMRNRTAIPAK